MATNIDSFSAPQQRGIAAKYPYDQWFNGAIWRITQGEDFDCKPQNVRSTLRVQAWRKGLGFTSRIIGDTVEFQVAPLASVAR